MAYMIFIVVIGGIGTMEGPIVGVRAEGELFAIRRRLVTSPQHQRDQ